MKPDDINEILYIIKDVFSDFESIEINFDFKSVVGDFEINFKKENSKLIYFLIKEKEED